MNRGAFQANLPSISESADVPVFLAAGLLLLACAAGSASAPAAAAPATRDAAAAWTLDDIGVTQSVEGKERASTRFEVLANGDARVAVSLDDGGVHTTGTILLIGGRWMLARGFAPTPAKAVGALDVAALNSQLVIVLLNAALPDGPPANGAASGVHFKEKTQRIRIATATSTGVYDAPWGVEGTLSAADADGARSFRLTFSCTEAGHPSTTVFAGRVSNAQPQPQLPDSMKLAGWTLRRISGRTTAAATAATSGSGARSPEHKPATIGELRKLE
jgi:hypothetical protein